MTYSFYYVRFKEIPAIAFFSVLTFSSNKTNMSSPPDCVFNYVIIILHSCPVHYQLSALMNLVLFLKLLPLLFHQQCGQQPLAQSLESVRVLTLRGQRAHYQLP